MTHNIFLSDQKMGDDDPLKVNEKWIGSEYLFMKGSTLQHYNAAIKKPGEYPGF